MSEPESTIGGIDWHRTGLHLCRIVTDEHGPMFDPIETVLLDALRTLQLPVSQGVNALSETRLNLLVGATVMLDPSAAEEILSAGIPYLLFQAEALDESRGFLQLKPAYRELLLNATQIWDYSPTNVQFLRRLGVADVRLLPFGYCAELDVVRRTAPPELEVFFFGSMTPRRQKLIDRLKAAGLSVESPFGVYGTDLQQRLANAKIVLNVHQFGLPHLEVLRLSYLLTNRCFVISEHGDQAPYPGGIVLGRYEELPGLCVDYARPERAADRDRIAAQGQASLQHLALSPAIEAALSTL